MTKLPLNPIQPPNSAPSESAVAQQVVNVLQSRKVPLSVMQSLAHGRKEAVAKVLQQHVSNGAILSLFGKWSAYLNQHRLVSSLSFASLVLFTFLLTQQLEQHSLQNSDAFLLASDLPPEAFADKGFDTWIEAKAHY